MTLNPVGVPRIGVVFSLGQIYQNIIIKISTQNAKIIGRGQGQ